MKKILAMALVAAMSLTMLAGCGGSGDANTNADANVANTEVASTEATTPEVTDVTLTVWAPDNQQELLKTQQADFAAAHPEYNITWVNAAVGEDVAKDEILKDVEAAADVFFYANDQVQELVKAGAIARLGGETEAMVNETMAASVVDTVKVGDALYGIPFTHNTFFMFYDKALLEGVDITSLDAILAAPTAEGVYNFRFDDAGGWKLGAWFYGADLQVFGADGSDLAAGCDWNSEKGTAVTQYLVNMINNPKVNSTDDVFELIGEKKLAAWFTGSWDYENAKKALGDDLGVATIPTYTLNGEQVQLKGFYGSKAIGVNAQSKNIALAIQFAAYLGSEEQQVARFTQSGQVPTNINAAAIDAVQNDEVAAVIVAESNNCSVAQPTDATFSSRYWSKAGLFITDIKGNALTVDNAQEWLNTWVDALCAE